MADLPENELPAAPTSPPTPSSSSPPTSSAAAPSSAQPAAAPTAAAPAAPAAPAQATEQLPDWARKEIGAKHRQLLERAEEAERLKRRIAELEAQGGGPASAADDEPAEPVAAAPVRRPTASAQQPADIDAEVEKRVQMRRQLETFNEGCNNLIAEGRKNFADFDATIQTITDLGGLPPDQVMEVLGTDSPAKVMYQLGKNPELVQQLRTMTPQRRMNELVKLSMNAGPKMPVSSAPPPVEPISGNVQPDPLALRDDMGDDEWYKRRAAQRKARMNGQAA